MIEVTARDLIHSYHLEREVKRLRALNVELLAALERIEPELYVASEIAHIARAAIAKARSET